MWPKKSKLDKFSDEALYHAAYLEDLIGQAIREEQAKPENEQSLTVVNWLIARREW